MASYTPNLDLLKKSPVTDGDDMFNVETMLNENWDRIDRGVGDYTTPAQKMGLTGDLSVGASLGVLANIGNVHVWRKTVTTDEGIPEVPEVPPSYELGEAQTQYFIRDKDRGKAITMLYSNSVSVSYDGRVSLVSPSSVVITTTNTTYPFTYVSGKFIQAQGGGTGVEPETTSIFYMKPSGVLQNSGESSSWDVYGTECQMVNGIAAVPGTPAVPPGTHVTYLTSTNRNAYQEGADGSEKPAGYTLGAVKTGKKALSDLSNYIYSVTWQYGDSVAVSDDGKVSIKNPTQISISATNDSEIEKAKVILGKFATPMSNCGFEYGKIYFFPSDSQISRESLPIYDTTTTNIDKYQEVTGYPAIPAGTTIEYLGVLGDPGKQIVFGEFIGDNTAGREIKLGFKPSMVVLIPHSYINLRIDLGTTDTPFWCMVPGCDYETSAYPLSEEYMYITEKGFIVSYDSDASEIYWNQQYKSYYYLALE